MTIEGTISLKEKNAKEMIVNHLQLQWKRLTRIKTTTVIQRKKKTCYNFNKLPKL